MTYTVQQGDSLSKIARDVLGDMSMWEEIARINNISNANVIYPGQTLQLPEPKPQAQTQKAGVGGWIFGGLLFLITAGAIYKKWKDNKQKAA